MQLFTQISLLTVILILFLSTALFYVSRQSMIKNITMSDDLMLSRISNNIEVTHNYMKQFGVSVFNSLSAVALMEIPHLGIIDQSMYTRNINDTIKSNPYVYSIYIINRDLDNYYIIGPYSSAGKDHFYDKDILRVLDNMKSEDILHPIPRKIPENDLSENKYLNVYSYILVDKRNRSDQADSVVVVNLKAEWIQGNIRNANENLNKIRMSIIDKNGNVIADAPERLFKENPADDPLVREILSLGKDSGSFTVDVDNVKSHVTYIYNDTLQWYILSVIPQRSITAHVDIVRDVTVVICVIVLLASVLLSFFLSKRLYTPVGNLFNEVRKIQPAVQNPVDETNEFNFISNLIKENINKIDTLKTFQNDNFQTLRDNFIRSLLSDGMKNTSELAIGLHKYDIGLKANKSVIVILLKIDGYLSFLNANNEDDRALYRFAVRNISEEILANHFVCASSDADDHVVIIGNIVETAAAEQNHYEILISLIGDIKNAVRYYFGLSLSASFSSISNNMADIKTLYNEALELSNYRFIYGYGSIIIPGSVKIRYDDTFKFPYGIVKEIIGALKLSRPDQASKAYEKYVSYIVGYSYNYIRFSLTQLLLYIYNELNILRSSGVAFTDAEMNYISMLDRINSHETIEQVNMEFRRLFKVITDKLAKSKNEKTEMVIKAAISYINGNYADCNLSTNSVAEKVMMSPVYLGIIFREATSKSVYDYINDVRLTKAEELLKNTDYTIAEILEKIGWQNQKYFYVKFKKHFGVTPSTYRVNRLALE